MCAVSPAAFVRLRLAATQVATSKKKRFSANWITFGKCVDFYQRRLDDNRSLALFVEENAAKKKKI